MEKRIPEIRQKLSKNPKPKQTSEEPHSPASDHSLPSGAEASNLTAGSHSVPVRRLFHSTEDVRKEHPRSAAGLDMKTSSTKKTTIADDYIVRLTKLFNEVADSLLGLDRQKAVITEAENQFSSLTHTEKANYVKSMSVDVARDLLYAELLKAEQNEKKISLLLKRNHDLENKLMLAETHANRINGEFYDKLHDEVKEFYSVMGSREKELLAHNQQLDEDLHQTKERLTLITAQADSMTKQLEDVNRQHVSTQQELSEANKQSKMVTLQRDQARSDTEHVRKELEDIRVQLTEARKGESDARREAKKQAEIARNARADEEDRVRQITLESNRQLADRSKQANDELVKERKKFTDQLSSLEKRYKESEAEKVRERRRADEAERALADLEETFEQRIRDEIVKVQGRLAHGYRDMMMDIAPPRRIAHSNESGHRSADEDRKVKVRRLLEKRLNRVT